MTDELERIWKEAVVAQSRYYPEVEWRYEKIQDRVYPVRFEPSTSEYTSSALPPHHIARYNISK
jgi:hypothetical protein